MLHKRNQYLKDKAKVHKETIHITQDADECETVAATVDKFVTYDEFLADVMRLEYEPPAY